MGALLNSADVVSREQREREMTGVTHEDMKFLGLKLTVLRVLASGAGICALKPVSVAFRSDRGSQASLFLIGWWNVGYGD